MAEPPLPRNPPQFSLRALLAAVTLAGIVLAVGNVYGFLCSVAAGFFILAAALWIACLRGRHDAAWDVVVLMVTSLLYGVANYLAVMMAAGSALGPTSAVELVTYFILPAPVLAGLVVGLWFIILEARLSAVLGFWSFLAAAAFANLQVLAWAYASV